MGDVPLLCCLAGWRRIHGLACTGDTVIFNTTFSLSGVWITRLCRGGSLAPCLGVGVVASDHSALARSWHVCKESGASRSPNTGPADMESTGVGSAKGPDDPDSLSRHHPV